MISFPNCKINLGLNIVGKRSDGYHNLETVFYPIDYTDALEIIQASEFKFTSTGLSVEGDIEDNLCVKAYQLLKADFPHLPGVSIHLHKTIAMGAGLGGGSADAAFMLTMLNRKFDLNLTQENLLKYALKLGSDCPFFIINKASYASGRGEILEKINVDLSVYKIILINPGIHVSTKDAFAELTPKVPVKKITEIVQEPIQTWKDQLINDFEKTVFKKHESIGEIKKALYDQGAHYASMSGSGSTVYGIFEKTSSPDFNFPANYLKVVI